MVPEDSKEANGTPVFKNGRNYWPGSLTSVPRKVKKWLILVTIFEHEDKKVARSSQHGFIKRKSCLTNLIAFYDELTTLMDEGRVAGGCLDFRKYFHDVSHNIFMDKLRHRGWMSRQ